MQAGSEKEGKMGDDTLGGGGRRVADGAGLPVPVSTVAFFLVAGADRVGHLVSVSMAAFLVQVVPSWVGVLFLFDPLLENKLITKNSNNRTVMQ
jgi:hypothetical protein